jgi:hypothetical protein
MRPYAVVIALLASLQCGILSAQEAPLPQLGARVRVTSALLTPPVHTGILSEFNSEAVTVGKERVPRPMIQSLEISDGHRRNWGRGALIGLLGGALFGAAAGQFDPHCFNKSACILGGAAAFGVIGIPTGLIIGGAIRTERWTRVTLEGG